MNFANSFSDSVLQKIDHINYNLLMLYKVKPIKKTVWNNVNKKNIKQKKSGSIKKTIVLLFFWKFAIFVTGS